YELARLSAAEVDAELDGCDRVLRAITGAPPRGFRAPGYDLSPAMLDRLARGGHPPPSSPFPPPRGSPAHARRLSGLSLPPPTRGPAAAPDRPAMTAPWRRGQAPVVELPVAVTPWMRLPAIGTSLIVAPAIVRRRLVRAMARRAFFNFELHGIDFADAEKDGI